MYWKDDREDLTKILGKDRVLELGGQRFYLDLSRPVGRGGTCLVYHAWKEEPEGLPRRVILKEFYPLLDPASGIRIRRKSDGSLALPLETGGGSEEYEIKKKRFCASYEMFKLFYNREVTNNYTVQGQALLGTEEPVNGTIYMVVDDSHAISLEEYIRKEPSLYQFLQILKKLAEVMAEIHKAGYIHLDLTPANILYFQDEYIKIMDTDSFVRKIDFLEEKPIYLSISSGYAAPEVLRYDDGNFVDRQRFAARGETADIFSVGAILYRYLYGASLQLTQTDRVELDREAVRWLLQARGYEETLEEKIREHYGDAPGKAILLIRELLRHTLTKTTRDRIGNMSQLAERIGQILPFVKPDEVRLEENFRPDPYPIYGREAQLEQIGEALKGQKGRGRIVCITGMGGIGKSTLARAYAMRQQAVYDAIIEISTASAREAIDLIGIANWKEEEYALDQNERALWLRRKRKICGLMSETRALLIVHDYNVSQDAEFGIWSELGCDILLTSWHDWSRSGVTTIQLKTVDLAPDREPQAAEQIFRQYYLQTAREEGDACREGRLIDLLETESRELERLLKQLNYHPLGIKLMAKQMSGMPGSETTPSMALRQLEETGCILDDRIAFQDGHDGAIWDQTMEAHLEAIFVAALQSGGLSEAEQEALRYMTLVSPQYGISASRFEQWTGVDRIYVERLRKKGWLEYRPGQSDPLAQELGVYGVYHMPMILADVLHKQDPLCSRIQNTGRFLNYAIQSVKEYGDHRQRAALLAGQETVLRYLQEEGTLEYGDLLAQVGHTLHEMDGTASAGRKCIAYCEKRLQIHRSLTGDHNNRIFRDCYDLSVLYYEMGDLENTIRYTEMALQMQEEQGYPDEISLMAARMNLGIIYWEKGALGQAERHLEDAYIRFRDHGPGPRSSWAAHCLSNMGYMYYRLGEWQLGHDYLLAACKLLGENGEQEHYARQIRNLGNLYMDRGEYEESIFCHRESYQIRSQLLGENHDLTRLSLTSLADACVRSGQIQEGLQYHRQVWEAMQEAYGVQPMDKALTCLNVALDCFRLPEEEDMGRRYLGLAYEYYTECAGRSIETPQDIIDAYIDWGVNAVKKEQVAKGLELIEMSQEIRYRFWGDNPELAHEYRVLAEILAGRGYEGRGQLYRDKADKMCVEP